MTNEIKRLDSFTFSPSPAQSEARWAAAKSKKAALLKSSDWTQLRDIHNILPPEQRLAWDIWRRRIRAIKQENFDTPEAYETALAALDFHSPVDDTPVAPIVDGDDLRREDSVSISPRDAIAEIVSLATSTIQRELGILNPVTFAERVSQATDAYVDLMTSSDVDGSKYPIIHQIAALTGQSMKQVATTTLARYQSWIAAAATLESLAEKAMEEVEGEDSTLDANKAVIQWLDEHVVELVGRSKAR